MRLGVISDIHGNCVALDAVLAVAAHHAVDRWVCLGDALQGGTQPGEVIDRLKTLDCPVVLGNADAFVLDGASGEEEITEEHAVVRTWTVEAIGGEGLEFIRTFVPKATVGGVLCFHGSPASYDTVLLPDTPADELARALETDAALQCGGHTHIQWTTTVGGSTFFNPGSVGLAFDFRLPSSAFYVYPFAEFAIVDADLRSVEFCRVPFDVDELNRVSRATTHPLAETLAARYRPPK